MAAKYKEGSLTVEEKRVVKRLLSDGCRGQDILALVNIGRVRTTNSGRITGVKQDKSQEPCSQTELANYLEIQRSFDLKLGLCPYRDERLYRAREAMILAVQLSNSPIFQFKSEIFAILSNIAWTYLCHAKLLKSGIGIEADDGMTVALSKMLDVPALGIPEPVKANISDIKKLRDMAEHKLLQRSDKLWRGLFQANCLNFENVMCGWFGRKVSLQNELSFSIQFVKPDIEQLSMLSNFGVPTEIAAFNNELKHQHEDEIKNSAEYEFSVVYTMMQASKSKSHIQFVNPDSPEGKEISNVLLKYKAADEIYPFKPKAVVDQVTKLAKKKFHMHLHTAAWKKHKIRPENGNPDPKKTQAKYCIYNKAHKDYTYSQAWVDLLVEEHSEP